MREIQITRDGAYEIVHASTVETYLVDEHMPYVPEIKASASPEPLDHLSKLGNASTQTKFDRGGADEEGNHHTIFAKSVVKS